MDKAHFYEYALRFCAREYTFSPKRKIILPESFYLIWIPDLVLVNAKEFAWRDTGQEPDAITLNPDYLPNSTERTGRVDFVTKIRALVSCPMQFKSYPADVQVCILLFRSCKSKVEFQKRFPFHLLFFTNALKPTAHRPI